MTRKTSLILSLLFMVLSPNLMADDVLLNEWNAVGTGRAISDGDAFFGVDFDGNGGNWMELIVVNDVDMRGWQLRWTEQEAAANGDPISEGTLTFADADLWSDVKAGTLITIIESEDAGGQGVETGTDTSYDPAGGDWTINISTFAELDAAFPLITTVTNDGMDSEFSVGNDDWNLTIMDASGAVISGPTGEGAQDEAGNTIWMGSGVGSSEAGSLEGPGRGAPRACWESITAASAFYDDTDSSSFGLPNVDFIVDTGSYRTIQDLTALRGGSPEGFGDFDSSGEFDLADIDALSAQIALETHSPCYDLTEDGVVDVADLEELVVNRVGTLMGDVDLDGDVDEFDYEVWDMNKFAPATTWATGDFNGDGTTDVSDFNYWNANKTSGAESTRSAVPEPRTLTLLWIGILLAYGRQRSLFATLLKRTRRA